MSLARRIAGAEALLRVLSPGLRVVEISGGLAKGVADIATVDGAQIEREPDEATDAFRLRAAALAMAAGARLLVFGGLPKMPMDDQGAPA